MKKQDDSETLILGIDDAGRGPLIGPMVLAGCLITSDKEKMFKDLGVKDSKLLPPKKRELLARVIKEKATKYYVDTTSANDIDNLLNGGVNLNKVEAIKAAKVISELTKDSTKKIQVVIDCPSTNRESWKNDVIMELKDIKNLTIICEHKADRDYIAVSAASILAKSRREEEIGKLKAKIGLDFGSGYPNDPKTKDFLEKHGDEFKNEDIFRETWATFKKHHAKTGQKSLF
jgi:ribonuclease HII